MTELMRTLALFWGQFGVPAYMVSNVPAGAQLPYITYEVSEPQFNGTAVLTAYNWHRRDEISANRDRAELMDKIATALPTGGLMVAVGAGFALLRRNDATFQQPWMDDLQTDVIGGRTSYLMTLYRP